MYPAPALLEPAVEMLDTLWAEWERQGRPTVTAGSTDQLRPHPLVTMIRDQLRLVDELLPWENPSRKGWPLDRPPPGTNHRPTVARLEKNP